MTGRSTSGSNQGDGAKTTRVLVAGIILILAAAAITVGMGSALAIGDEPASPGHADLADQQDIAAGDILAESDLTAEPAAASAGESLALEHDYIVEVERQKGEAGETVEVPIRAKTLIGDYDDATVTGYEVGLEFDENQLLYKSADSPVAADELEVIMDPDDPGRVDLEFDSSVWDNILDKIIGGVTGEDPFPTMNTTMARVEFHVVGDVNDTADINLVDPDSSLWHGLTDWFGKYDDDNVLFTGGQVDIVDEIEEDGPTVGVPEYEVEAGNTGGYVAISEDPDDVDNAEEEGVKFPSCDSGECINIEGLTYDTGYWESTAVEFPTLEDDAGVEVDVVAPDGLWGTIDRPNGSMTARGELRAMVDGDPDDDFFFEVNATTGDSGVMSGMTENFNQSEATITAVDNEFVVADSTGTAVDPGLGIPNENPGENYLELPLEMSFEEADEGAIPGEIEVHVSDTDGEPLQDAQVNVEDGPDGLTGEDGSMLFETNPGSYEAIVSKSGYEDATIEFDVVPDEYSETSVELEVAETFFNVTAFGDDVRAGDTATASVGVVNEGGPGTQKVSLTIEDTGVSTTESLDLDVGEHQSFEVSWSTEPGDEGIYGVTAASGDTSDVAEIEVDEELGDGGEIVALFSATSVIGGWISFDEDTSIPEAKEEGLEIPPANASDDREIQIEGEIYEDGTWQSTGVEFPTLYHDGIKAEVDVPGGMAGFIDPESESMTGEGTLEVTLPEGDPFSFNVDMGTDTSGALEGDVDFGTDPVEATLVDNEFTIHDQTGEGWMDDALGLPATTTGAQWLELEMELDIDQDVDLARGTITGTVTDESGQALEGVTVDVQDEVADATTDEAGEYELDIDEGTYTLVVDADGFNPETATVEVIEDQTTEQDFVLEGGDAAFEVDIDGDYVTEGEVADISITVENTGDGAGSTEVAVAFADESATKTIDLDAGETFSDTFEWQTEEGDAGEYVATIEAGEDTASADVIVEEEREPSDDIDAIFTAESIGGYVATDEATRADAIEEGIEFPAKGEDDEHIMIAGEIADGEWHSTSVHFPTVETEEGIEADVEVLGSLSGEVDRDAGLFTANGVLEVAIDELDFSFDLELTTGDSGSLSGEVAAGELSLVDNQFIVDEQTGSPVLDDQLGLPATDPGSNWLELDMAMEFEEIEDPDDIADPGTIAGTVTGGNSEPVEDATVDVEGEIYQETTDASGNYEIDLEAGTYTVAVDADGHEPTSETVSVEAGETATAGFDLEFADAELDADASATAIGESTVLVEATVWNVGEGPAHEEVTITLGEHATTETAEIGPGEDEQFSVEWEVEDDPTSYEAAIEAGDASATAPVTLEEDDEDTEREDDESATVFEAVGQGGFIGIAEDTLEGVHEEGLDLPAADTNETYIELRGIIHDDGTWETTDSYFPTLEVTDELMAGVELPDGLSGEIDRETGEMSASGNLIVEVLDIEDGEPIDADTIEFEFEVTTGESGDLAGSTTLAGGNGSVTLVNNEYVIDDQTGDPLIDGELELPATRPGQNWLQLEFDVEIEEGVDPDEVGDDDSLGGSEESAGPGQDDGDDDSNSFLAAFGQLIGLLGVAGAVVVVGGGLATRVMTAMDPDPRQ